MSIIRTSLDKKVRKLYNSNKPIRCCPESLEDFRNGETGYVTLNINSEWIRFEPKTNPQAKKVRDYKNYAFETVK
jgi:hypothetical protein